MCLRVCWNHRSVMVIVDVHFALYVENLVRGVMAIPANAETIEVMASIHEVLHHLVVHVMHWLWCMGSHRYDAACCVIMLEHALLADNVVVAIEIINVSVLLCETCCCAEYHHSDDHHALECCLHNH